MIASRYVPGPVMVAVGLFAVTGGGPRPGNVVAAGEAPAAAKARAAAWSGKPITLEVDAREAPRKRLQARLLLPAAPGPLTLVYPQWIPGEHGPTGPIADLAGLRFAAAGKPVPWRRDPVDMFAFHLEVPAGSDALEATFEYLSPPDSEGFTSGASATAQLTVVSWNQVLLYPKGAASDALTYAASLRLPAGWKYGTALPVGRETAERVEFAPVSLTTLVDSPVLAGAHFHTFALTTAAPAHQVHAAADSEAALEAPPPVVAGWKSLVAETGVLFGARHYRSYSFLLTLSDHTAHFGLEHHESSDDRVRERSLVDEDARRVAAGLLPHEMTHSWNGKYRRPTGLATGNFDTPMRGELLWVYEGLTTYLGQVLAARSGLLTADEYRESLALTAAGMDHQRGRTWRPLLDTTIAAQILYGARGDWGGWRRGVDFYPEGELLWLEADALIRSATGGAKSLDDFCRLFYGGTSGPPQMVPFTFDDVVSALQRVAPYDWRGFWRSRVEETTTGAPLGGVAGGGWKLVYADSVPRMLRSHEAVGKTVDVRFSIGITLAENGRIDDVIPGSPADRAGVAPGMKLVAVNGRRLSPEILRQAIRDTRARARPLELLTENGEFFATHRLEYDGGERYPRLERDPTRADLLSEIIRPRASAP